MILLGCIVATFWYNKELEDFPINIGLTYSRSSLPMILADDIGKFKNKQLNVNLFFYESQCKMEKAFNKKEIDGFVNDLHRILILKKKEEDLVILASVLGGGIKEGRYAIVAGPKSRANQPSDIKGKKISLTKGATSELITDLLLESQSISPNEVIKIEDINLENRLHNLLDEKVDFATFPEPLITFAKALGCSVILDDTDNSLHFVDLCFRKTKVEQHLLHFEIFIKIYNEMVFHINQNPEKYYKKLLDIASKPSSQPDSFRAALLAFPSAPKYINERHVIPHYSQNKIPKSTEINLVQNWLLKNKYLNKPFKYKDIVFTYFYKNSMDP